MNTPSTVLQESEVSVHNAAAPNSRPFYWSLRREIWGNRSIYIVPLVSAAVSLGSFLLNTILMRRSMHGVWPTYPAELHDLLNYPYQLAGALIMGSALLVGIFYSLDSLYGERRERSILFWKSLPVSDLTAVLAKATVPIVILPLLRFAITIITQLLMLLLSSLVLLGSGLSLATLWEHASPFRFSLTLLYHMVTVHGLWYAPLYGWLFFVSAWAPRGPFIWAFLPPLLIGAVESHVLPSRHFFNMLLRRLVGPDGPVPRNG